LRESGKCSQVPLPCSTKLASCQQHPIAATLIGGLLLACGLVNRKLTRLPLLVQLGLATSGATVLSWTGYRQLLAPKEMVRNPAPVIAPTKPLVQGDKQIENIESNEENVEELEELESDSEDDEQEPPLAPERDSITTTLPRIEDPSGEDQSETIEQLEDAKEELDLGDHSFSSSPQSSEQALNDGVNLSSSMPTSTTEVEINSVNFHEPEEAEISSAESESSSISRSSSDIESNATNFHEPTDPAPSSAIAVKTVKHQTFQQFTSKFEQLKQKYPSADEGLVINQETGEVRGRSLIKRLAEAKGTTPYRENVEQRWMLRMRHGSKRSYSLPCEASLQAVGFKGKQRKNETKALVWRLNNELATKKRQAEQRKQKRERERELKKLQQEQQRREEVELDQTMAEFTPLDLTPEIPPDQDWIEINS
jgi:hypothetical protein